MTNKYPRYIKIFSIYILGLEFTWNIGNPLWFIQEIKNIKKEGENNAKSCKKCIKNKSK